MKKKKVKAPYGIDNKTGKGKALVFEADLTNKDDADFVSDLEAVSATKPANLQEFLMRLNDLQKFNQDNENNGETIN